MKILSWNIWVDCHFDELKDFLKSSNADIVGLQELKDDDPDRDVISLMSQLGYEYFFAETQQVWDGKMYRHGPAIFTKFPIVKSEKIQIEVGDDERAAAYVQIDLGDTLLHVFSTHLIHTHQQPSLEQEAQIVKLIAHLPSERVIVMGDFNATPESKGFHMMNKVLVNTDSELLPTWSVHPEGCPKCLPQHIDTKLDYIFVSKDISFDTFKVENSKASDHLPISVNIKL